MDKSCQDCIYCKSLYIPKVYEEPELASGKPFHTLNGHPICTLFCNDGESGQAMWINGTGMCEMFAPKKKEEEQ